MINPILAPTTLPPQAPVAPVAAVTARMRETAEAFEASFLSQMLKPMFEGISTEAPFGGGEAEGTWRGFLVEAMAKQAVRGGGIGLADQVVAEMLRMQEQGQEQ